MHSPAPHVAIVGAGIGGLAAALRLAHGGARVTVLECHSTVGGKMRTVPSIAGPVDAGPTVLTMKHVFDGLFADVGLRLEDHVTLESEPTLARHFWPDGTVLDLMRNASQSADNVGQVFGAKAAKEFTAFCAQAKLLFETFDAPMIRADAPSQLDLTLSAMRNPRVLSAMKPMQTLSKSLSRQFSDPRLAQLFARYATYVGGVPNCSPALLSLIWHVESQGVWHVKGGMHRLAQSIAKCAKEFGAVFEFNRTVTRIEMQDGRTCAVHTDAGRIPVDAILFNGDPLALREGKLGPLAELAVPKTAVTPRSLSASVFSFAAKASDVPLAAHNVFFADDPNREYAPLVQGHAQTDPTLYVCAQDRFGGHVPSGAERFEIILNSPPIADSTAPNSAAQEREKDQCHSLILQRLKHFGLTFSEQPNLSDLTVPREFDSLFPASKGSLYGRSPHGMLAPMKRPTARTPLTGLYLTGGGVHPGPGVPMATLSGRHAAAAILSDLTSTSMSPLADTRGGTSTGLATTGPALFRSSGS